MLENLVLTDAVIKTNRDASDWLELDKWVEVESNEVVAHTYKILMYTVDLNVK
jgi:hypothetical protein